jgi:hypothetical protein
MIFGIVIAAAVIAVAVAASPLASCSWRRDTAQPFKLPDSRVDALFEVCSLKLAVLWCECETFVRVRLHHERVLDIFESLLPIQLC